MKRNLLLLLPWILTFPLDAAVRVIESTPSRLIFSWELGAVDTASVLDADTYVTALSFGDENIVLGDYGEAVIPAYSVYAGMPVSGEVQVTFSPGSTRTLRLEHPLKRHPERDGRLHTGSRTDIRQGPGWVTAPRYTWFRNVRAAHIVIAPVRYDEQSRSVELLERGVCTILFPHSFQSAPASAVRESDYQKMLKKLLLNYGTALTWAKPLSRPLRKAADPYPFDYNQVVYTFTIGDGHAGTNEMTVRENGILKLPGAQIKRLFSRDSSLIGMTRVALYGSWKGPLPMGAPAMGAIPAGVKELPLFRFDANRNGIVDDEDYFLAFVTGLSDWSYDTLRHEFVFKVDPYADNRTYWLALKSSGSGATMGKFVQPAGAPDTTEKFLNRIIFKQSEFKFVRVEYGIPRIDDALGFVWVVLKPNFRDFSYPLDLPYCDTTDSGSILFKSFDYKDGSVTVDARVGTDSVCTNCMMDTEYPIRRWGDKRLRMTMTNPQTTYYLQLNHALVKYQSSLNLSRDTIRLLAFSKIDSVPVTYRISGLNNRRVWVLRITDNEDSVSLVDTVSAAGTFTWNDGGNAGVRYAIANEAGLIMLRDDAFSRPQRAVASGGVITQLRDINNESDYLIIAPPVFLTQAKRLAEHKAKIGFTAPRVVSVEDIYTDFAGGNLDPAAIRNFLAFAQRNWKGGDRLDYVVLMGSGHYDYKNVKTTEPNHIIPAELGRDKYPSFNDMSCVDDYYAFLGTGDTNAMSLAIGRLPCVTENDAAVIVDKIIQTENIQKADWGSWRNSALLIADDDMQGDREDQIRGNYGHHVSSERVAAIIGANRPSIDLRKTYLFDYPWNAGWEKPEASRAIINEINRGVGYVNYFGHGSDVFWADEHVLSPDILPQLYNDKRYPVVSSYSCSVGKFDRPENVSLGELLVTLPNAGAIASFAGTRSTSASGNEVLAMDIYAALFDSLDNTSLGMAILRGKALHHDLNSMVYTLFGDPSLRLVNAVKTVALEVLDTTGAVRDTFMALEKMRIKGTIRNATGSIDGAFGTTTPAFVQVGVFNAPELTTRKDQGKDTRVEYLQPGKPIFSGRFTIRGGTFEQTIVLPQNLTFDKPGARLIAYAWQNDVHAIGCKRSLVFHGTKPTEQKDSTGPRISIRPVYDVPNLLSTSASFTGRVTASLPLKCEIVLDDPSGINVMGSGPDEGLTMEVPGAMSRRNINHKFQFAEGDYRSGTAVTAFEEHSLKKGTYDLIVTSQDLLGNVSKATFTLEIVDENEPKLDRVFNTPNPVRMGQTTRFFFYPSTAQQPFMTARFVIKIFSMSGKLLRVLKDARNGEAWDLKDQTGYQLPPNIYLYQVTGYYMDEKQVKSKIQKIVIHPPR